MTPVPPDYGLFLSVIVFLIGLLGVLVRRNIVFILISVEVMLNAGSLTFISAGARWGQADGQVMYLIIIALAATEVAIGLALILQMYRRIESLDTDLADRMKG